MSPMNSQFTGRTDVNYANALTWTRKKYFENLFMQENVTRVKSSQKVCFLE